MPTNLAAPGEVLPGVEAAAAPAGEEAKKKRALKGKGGAHVASGVAHVEASFNNTKVYITDNRGNVVSWCSSGRLGFKGSKRSTAYVGQLVGADAAKRAATLGMREIQVRIFGPGAGRESAVRGVASTGMEVTAIQDVTPVPHNGCRPPKRRRI
ncbi:MAG: 30S ribosomal protein S11 [Lentisphaeria bacterium]